MAKLRKAETYMNVFEDEEYVKLKNKIRSLESVEDAIALIASLDTTVQLCRWVEVDIFHHFMKLDKAKLSALKSHLVYTFNRDYSYCSQLEKVAEVFGDESKRFPLLTFWHHVVLAYAYPHLGEEAIRDLAEKAIANFWSVNELRSRVKMVRYQKVISESQKKEDRQVSLDSKESAELVANPPQSDITCEPILSPPLMEPSQPSANEESPYMVDIAQQVEESEKIKDDEAQRRFADIAIRLYDTYLYSKRHYRHSQFFKILKAAFGNLWWEFLAFVLAESTEYLEEALYSPTDISTLTEKINKFIDGVLKVEQEKPIKAVADSDLELELLYEP